MFTTIALCLIDFAFAVFLIYDSYVQANRFGKTQVAVRLRRRVADAVFLNLIPEHLRFKDYSNLIVAAGLYHEISVRHTMNSLALGLFFLLVLIHGLRYPKWRLKKDGFTAGGRYWPYDAIAAMQLSEDGVLVLTLQNGQPVILPVARIEDLEAAAAFFTGEEALQHLFNRAAPPAAGENKA